MVLIHHKPPPPQRRRITTAAYFTGRKAHLRMGRVQDPEGPGARTALAKPITGPITDGALEHHNSTGKTMCRPIAGCTMRA